MITLAEYQTLYDSINLKTYISILEEVVSIDKNRLDLELETQAKLYTFFSGMCVMAKQKMDAAFHRIENFTTIEKNNYRNTSGKASVDVVESYVKGKEDYINLRDTHLQLTEKYELLKALCRGLEQKKDMLVQLSSNARAETKLYK